MQVYRDLQVITACPSELEEQQAPHRLYRFLDGAKTCSAAFWAEHAMHQIEQAWAEDKLPILVGGTGMYFKVLLDGIARVPDIPDEIRQEVRRQCAEAGSAVLHTELQMSDPVIAKRLAPGDSQRICRAVEVERATGTPLSEWQKKPNLVRCKLTTSRGPLRNSFCCLKGRYFMNVAIGVSTSCWKKAG